MRPRHEAIQAFRAIPDHERFHELIGGEIVPKARPGGEHGGAQAGVVGVIRPPFHRKANGPSGPGGWWIAVEVEILLEPDIVCPDIVGWRRDHCPARPIGMPVRQRPDWMCEIISPSNAKHDTVKKLQLYHRAAIPHYWLVDPRDATLTVMRWSSDGYVTRMRAERGAVVRPEPFDAIKIAVGRVFGDDPVDDEPPPGSR